MKKDVKKKTLCQEPLVRDQGNVALGFAKATWFLSMLRIFHLFFHLTNTCLPPVKDRRENSDMSNIFHLTFYLHKNQRFLNFENFQFSKSQRLDGKF